MPSPRALVKVLPSQTRRRPGPYTKTRRDKTKVFLLGLQILDGRSPAVRAYSAYRRELTDQLGGPDNVSATQRHLIELVVRGLVFVNHVDAQLLGQRSLVLGKGKNKKTQSLLLERMHISNIVAKQLSMLGLEKRTRIRSLTDDLLKARPVGESE